MFDYLKNLNVLVIDDFAQFRQTIKTMLLKFGPKSIDQASTSSKGLSLCMENSYDVILCDYNLGEGQDGQQLLEELHERKVLLKGVIFMMVTAETTSIQVMAAIEYRPDSYLTKPFTPEELGQRLKRLLKKNEKLKPLNDAFNQKKYDKALELCDSIIESDPSAQYSCLRIKSEVLDIQKKYPECLELFHNVAAQQPLLWAILGIGKIYYAQGNNEQALDHFLQMRKDFPQQVNVLDWIAKCQKSNGKDAEAEQTLLDAIDISPKSVRRQVELGEIAQSLQHHEVAHKAFEKTISYGFHSCLLKPKHYQHYYESAEAVAANMGNVEKGRMLATTEALAKRMESKYQKDPSSLAGNLGSLAQLFSAVERDSQSETFLSKLSTTLDKPECRISDEQFGTIEEKLGKLSEKHGSTRLLDKLSTRMESVKGEIAVQKQNDLSAADFNRQGMQLVKSKQLAEALDKIREAVKLAPHNSSYSLNAAQIILLNKDFRAQSSMVEEARELLSALTIESSGRYWQSYKKISAYLPDER